LGALQIDDDDDDDEDEDEDEEEGGRQFYEL